MEGRTEVKQYTPPPVERGYNYTCKREQKNSGNKGGKELCVDTMVMLDIYYL